MSESGRGSAAGAQVPPPAAGRTAVPPQLLHEETEGGTGRVDSGRVDKHVKPLVKMVLLVENPSARGFTRLSAQLVDTARGLGKAHRLITPDSRRQRGQ